jgi:hypothetical protein
VVLLGLAAAVAVTAPRRWTLLGVAVMAGVLAVLDGREALHQHDEARATLVAAAVALAAAHLAATALALLAYRQGKEAPVPHRPTPLSRDPASP